MGALFVVEVFPFDLVPVPRSTELLRDRDWPCENVRVWLLVGLGPAVGPAGSDFSVFREEAEPLFGMTRIDLDRVSIDDDVVFSTFLRGFLLLGDSLWIRRLNI